MKISNHENHCAVLQIIDVTNKNYSYPAPTEAGAAPPKLRHRGASVL